MTPSPTPAPAVASEASVVNESTASPGDAARQVESLRAELEQAHETIARLERRQRIDTLLVEAEAIDLEAARLLTEAAVSAMDEADVALAVRDLRRHRPYLFRRSEPGAAVALAMSAHAGGDDDPADEAAAHAAATGDRRDLLRYLRLRRR